MIEVTDQVSIPEEELRFTASHSSGPGGQNVNKVSSRVTLWFDVANSPTLSPEQKELIMRRLENRIGKNAARWKIRNWRWSGLWNWCRMH
jgi:ribosome-associated protein